MFARLILWSSMQPRSFILPPFTFTWYPLPTLPQHLPDTSFAYPPQATPSPPAPSHSPSPALPVLTPQHQLSTQHLARIVNDVRLQSCSRGNFCANMVRKLYNLEELKSSNVRGKLGENQLDSVQKTALEKAAFQIYPVGPGENRSKLWHQCVKAIDESCRRLNRSKP